MDPYPPEWSDQPFFQASRPHQQCHLVAVSWSSPWFVLNSWVSQVIDLRFCDVSCFTQLFTSLSCPHLLSYPFYHPEPQAAKNRSCGSCTRVNGSKAVGLIQVIHRHVLWWWYLWGKPWDNQNNKPNVTLAELGLSLTPTLERSIASDCKYMLIQDSLYWKFKNHFLMIQSCNSLHYKWISLFSRLWRLAGYRLLYPQLWLTYWWPLAFLSQNMPKQPNKLWLRSSLSTEITRSLFFLGAAGLRCPGFGKVFCRASQGCGDATSFHLTGEHHLFFGQKRCSDSPFWLSAFWSMISKKMMQNYWIIDHKLIVPKTSSVLAFGCGQLSLPTSWPSNQMGTNGEAGAWHHTSTPLERRQNWNMEFDVVSVGPV